MRKKHTHEYTATKIRPIMQIAARLVQKDPELANDMDKLWAFVQMAAPELKDQSVCGGCGRSMKVSLYEADLHDALLILAMGRVVRQNVRNGMSFTEANKVHIPTLVATQATLKRQTKCDYLGLIKQNENWSGTGYWCLTRWAWQALRGEPIHKAAKYWEGKLLGRSMATTTLTEMFENHRGLVQKALAKRASVKADYRARFEDYQPSEWISFDEEPRQEKLL